jgi:hypothetical protein
VLALLAIKRTERQTQAIRLIIHSFASASTNQPNQPNDTCADFYESIKASTYYYKKKITIHHLFDNGTPFIVVVVIVVVVAVCSCGKNNK